MQEKPVEFSIKRPGPQAPRSDCVIVGVFEPRRLAAANEAFSRATRQFIARVFESGDMEGKAGTTLLLRDVPDFPGERLLLVGLGKEKNFRDKDYCAALRTAFNALKETGCKDALVDLTQLPVKKQSASWCIRQAVLIAGEAQYRFDAFKSKKPEERPLAQLIFATGDKVKPSHADLALTQGEAIAEGVSLARTLGNLPGNVCTPTHLAETALGIAKEFSLESEILERDDMEALGMHSLLSVAKGSRQPPKLIVVHYRGGKPADKPVVLVGKGVTFDTGGISLKPGEGMDEMKFDMCGAASVLGTLQATARMRLPINLTVIAPCVENMPGGGASKPGDIVTSLSGQTIEILNTDAEGRLILCDALTYAERFEPAAVIDVATLTGACVIALGHVATGLFTDDDALADELLEAGDVSLDRAWRMPLWDDYQEQLKSNFADMANIGGRPAGSITAACFLSRFTKKYTWAHLDIAGTAWKSGGDKGATGRPVPLLTHFLLARAGKRR